MFCIVESWLQILFGVRKFQLSRLYNGKILCQWTGTKFRWFECVANCDGRPSEWLSPIGAAKLLHPCWWFSIAGTFSIVLKTLGQKRLCIQPIFRMETSTTQRRIYQHLLLVSPMCTLTCTIATFKAIGFLQKYGSMVGTQECMHLWPSTMASK